MDKIIIVPTPRDIKQVHSLISDIPGVYTRERPESFEEAGKVFVRVALGKNAAGVRRAEVNAFTGTQVNMQVDYSIKSPLVNVHFESFWDKVVDEVIAWTKTSTDVTFDDAPVIVNMDKNLFTLEGGRILFTFDDIRKLATLIGCLFIMFTASAQVSDKSWFDMTKKEQEKARKEMKEWSKFMEYVDKVLVPNTDYYSQQTVPTEVNIRIYAPPKLPKLQSSGTRIISIAPIYTSQYESTIRITGVGGGRKDD